jgi:hypothetical protein
MAPDEGLDEPIVAMFCTSSIQDNDRLRVVTGHRIEFGLDALLVSILLDTTGVDPKIGQAEVPGDFHGIPNGPRKVR